jgi:glutathione S-transferase
MKLYYVPSACSLSPHIALREANLPFKLDRIDVKAGKKTQTGADYVSINPKGYVPALELDDGQVLTEGAVIVQYIADLKPETKLAPPNGTLARVRLQEWLHYLATELHKGFSPLYRDNAGDEFKAWWRTNKVEPRIEFLSKSLEGKKFVMGDTFTVADAYAFYLMRAWQNALKGNLSRWKPLQDHFARVGDRPSVKAALEAEAAPV